MVTAKDIAVIVNVPIAKSGKVSIRAQIDGKYTSDSEASIFVPTDMKFSMKLHITPNVTELYYNDTHLLDYVHRVSPAEIREVFIEGPLIVEEVVFTPPQGSLLDPLPSYDQATSSSASIPLADMQRLSLGKPGASSSLTTKPTPAPVPSPFTVLTPTPGPPQIGLSSSIVNNPMPGVPLPSQPAGVLDRTPELSQNRSPSNSVSWNPFEQSSSTKKAPIYENNPTYTPTAFQQAQSTSSSSTPTPYHVVLPPDTPYSPQSSVQPLQPQSFTNQPLQPYQIQPYPTGSQATITPYPSSSQVQILPQQTYNPTPTAQVMPAPQPYTAQYPYPAQTPYVTPNPYPQAVPGMQMQPPYNAYQQTAPYQYPVQQGPYASGYAPQYYGNYPVMYGSGCHYRRSSSCCSD